jgi:hypothetical protein
MNRSNYCITHQRCCFAVGSSSSSCRHDNPSSEFDFETDTEKDDSKDEASDLYAEDEALHTLAHKQDQQARPMLIADLYVPSHIQSHRIVRGGRTPAQIQFQVEWKNGWTADKSLAKTVIRQHANQDLWFVEYRSSWEPYTSYYDTISHDMINAYRTNYDIESFGSGFDQLIEALSGTQRQSLEAEDLYPNYQFDYVEVSDDDECGSGADQADPPLKKRRGRPKKVKVPKPRRALHERNPDCGCSPLKCRDTFNLALRERIRQSSKHSRTLQPEARGFRILWR